MIHVHVYESVYVCTPYDMHTRSYIMEIIELSNKNLNRTKHNVHAFEFWVAGIFQFWNDFQLWRGKVIRIMNITCVLKRGMFQSVLFASDRNWITGCEQNRLFLDIHWAVFAIQRQRINKKNCFFFSVFFCVLVMKCRLGIRILFYMLPCIIADSNRISLKVFQLINSRTNIKYSIWHVSPLLPTEYLAFLLSSNQSNNETDFVATKSFRVVVYLINFQNGLLTISLSQKLISILFVCFLPFPKKILRDFWKNSQLTHFVLISNWPCIKV